MGAGIFILTESAFVIVMYSSRLGMSIETVPQDMRATTMGAYQALYGLGIFGGPLATGFFNDWLGLSDMNFSFVCVFIG